jgi:hypothetical protein
MSNPEDEDVCCQPGPAREWRLSSIQVGLLRLSPSPTSYHSQSMYVHSGDDDGDRYVPLSSLYALNPDFFHSDTESSLSSPPVSLSFLDADFVRSPVNISARMMFTIGSLLFSLQVMSHSLSGLSASARQAAQAHREFCKYSKQILQETQTSLRSARNILKKCSLSLKYQKNSELVVVHATECKYLRDMYFHSC